MRDREYKSRDKVVQKITRDGLIEKNLTSGQESRISQRMQDVSMRQQVVWNEENGRDISNEQRRKRTFEIYHLRKCR